jgi:hypothetical protein
MSLAEKHERSCILDGGWPHQFFICKISPSLARLTGCRAASGHFG